MADVNYTAQFKQSSGNVGVTVSRNSTTQPVDATVGAPNRLTIPFLMDQGFGTPPTTTVVSATAASPIVATVTTGTGTNFPSGSLVTVTGGLGDPNINGTFFVTTSTDAVTLLGSATAGTYTASSATMVKLNTAVSYQIALAGAMAAILNDKSVQG